jgi:hypothetical protein
MIADKRSPAGWAGGWVSAAAGWVSTAAGGWVEAGSPAAGCVAGAAQAADRKTKTTPKIRIMRSFFIFPPYRNTEEKIYLWFALASFDSVQMDSVPNIWKLLAPAIAPVFIIKL